MIALTRIRYGESAVLISAGVCSQMVPELALVPDGVRAYVSDWEVLRGPDGHPFLAIEALAPEPQGAA